MTDVETAPSEDPLAKQLPTSPGDDENTAESKVVDEEKGDNVNKKGAGDNAEKSVAEPFVSNLAKYEEMFKNRYTEKDPDYMKRVEDPAEPIIMHPWSMQQNNKWQDRRGPPNRNWNDRNRGGHDRRDNDRRDNDRRNYGGDRRDYGGNRNNFSRPFPSGGGGGGGGGGRYQPYRR